MSRIRIDLKKLPVWQQYVIAGVIVTIVVAAAWMVGRNQPVPAWINDYLVPVAGCFGLVAIAYLILLGKKK